MAKWFGDYCRHYSSDLAENLQNGRLGLQQILTNSGVDGWANVHKCSNVLVVTIYPCVFSTPINQGIFTKWFTLGSASFTRSTIFTRLTGLTRLTSVTFLHRNVPHPTWRSIHTQCQTIPCVSICIESRKWKGVKNGLQAATI